MNLLKNIFKKQSKTEQTNKYHTYLKLELNEHINIVTYYHIIQKPKQDAKGYSITIDKFKNKVCSVKPLTKNGIKNILENCKNRYYKDITAMDWLSVKNILAKI